jgi:small subunit ribosomal protein S16
VAVKIRLKRIGRPKHAYYKVVAIDSRKRRDGRPIEILGHYDPSAPDNKITLKRDRFDYWLKCGAQMSETVASLVRKMDRAAVSAGAP